MNDMISAGHAWQEHKRLDKSHGIEIDLEDTTWKQAEQMKESGFSWEVILGWKLAYARKRKYGKEIGVSEDVDCSR